MYGIQGKGGPSEGRQESNRQVSFHQHLHGSFLGTKVFCPQGSISQTCLRKTFSGEDPKSTKRLTVNSSVSFCALGICVQKAALKLNVGEINPWPNLINTFGAYLGA